jgi:hypothetical protein
VIAASLLVLPWVITLVLVRHHHLDVDEVSILAAVSIPLSGLWLTWVALAKDEGSGAPALTATKVADQLAASVRVTEADPQRLGVHAAISVPGVPDEIPPEYVPRDVDADEFGTRARVAAAAQRGGFVLLVGGSSVGKTRCAVEAVKALLPDWRLVHPAGPGQVVALAQASDSRIVVWLDELQRYLDGEQGLTGGVVRALLNAPDPVVIIGTLWPDRYVTYTAVPAPGDADPHAREREVLGLAAVIRIDAAFSPAEQDRARAAAARDRRLQIALATAGYGLTQTLAAAPQLVARWEDAKTANPYAWAVLTAALDVTRLGARAPLNTDFLRAAALGYCTSQQQAEAPSNWFERAMIYATGRLHGAVAALCPAGAGMSNIVGYTVADYLIQHASQERRQVHVPASTWDAVLSYIRDPADTARLADSAWGRLLYRYALALYRRAADAGDLNAAMKLAALLAERGDLDELRARADAGDWAADRWLAAQLAEGGDLDELRARADAGDWAAAQRLAGLLAERGDPDEAAQVLRAFADAGEEDAAYQLAALLGARGDLDGLGARAAVGDKHATQWLARRLVGLLAEGNPDGAAQALSALADAGDEDAAHQLAALLAEHGDLDGLRARADAGDEDAAHQLAALLAEHGDLDALRARADAGDKDAAHQLAALLAEHGDLDALRARADAGDKDAAHQLAALLARQGDWDEAAQILRPLADIGDQPAAALLAVFLGERGDLNELRARIYADDGYAATALIGLLEERGDLDEAARIVGARAATGDKIFAGQLANLLTDRLIKQGRVEEAEQLRRFGLNPDGSIACA